MSADIATKDQPGVQLDPGRPFGSEPGHAGSERAQALDQIATHLAELNQKMDRLIAAFEQRPAAGGTTEADAPDPIFPDCNTA